MSNTSATATAKVEKAKCITKDCGHEPDPGYDNCCGCEARRRKIAYRVVAAERRPNPSQIRPYLERGW